MNRVFSQFVGIAGSLLLLAACNAAPAAPAGNSSSDAAPAATAGSLTAIKVDAVALDGSAEYWKNAAVLTVPTKSTEEGGADGPDVLLQAAYDGTNVAIRLEWADTSEGTYSRPWVWDGAKFSRDPEKQDRMALIFPIENNAEFSSKGCAGACHNSDADKEKWWMGTEDAGLRLDMWQWTASSAVPLGLTNDQWVSVQTDPADAESATHPDENTGGGNLSNTNKEGDGPLYMHGTDLAARFIMTGEQIALDTSKLAVGAKIPTSVLAPFTGSRADIHANSVWKDGKWTVVLMRTLDTGNGDDLALTPPKSYPFGVAVFDHVDHWEHTVGSEVLTLQWQ